MHAFLGCAEARLGSLGPQGLSGLAWALAAMDYVPPRQWMRALAGQVSARWQAAGGMAMGSGEGEDARGALCQHPLTLLPCGVALRSRGPPLTEGTNQPVVALRVA